MPSNVIQKLTYGLELVISLLALSLSACSPSGGSKSADPNPNAVQDANLSGLIGGAAWSFNYGTARLNTTSNTFDVNLYSAGLASGDPCQLMPSAAQTALIFFIPHQVASFNLGDSQTVTFYIPPGTNDIATSGTLVISAITANAVEGKLQATFDQNDSLNGAFSAAICP